MCGEVRERLRPMVATRIAEAQHRIAELSAFATRLTAVHEELDDPAPVPTCGPGCGCVPADPPGPVPIELAAPRVAADPLPGCAR